MSPFLFRMPYMLCHHTGSQHQSLVAGRADAELELGLEYSRRHSVARECGMSRIYRLEDGQDALSILRASHLKPFLAV